MTCGPGREIALKIDQVLMHDAIGPLCALQLEAMGADSARVETAVGYIDHVVVEGDSRNADDHLMLESAAKRYGSRSTGRGTQAPPVGV